MYAFIKTDDANTQNGVVFEIIAPYFLQESDRPPKPEDLPEDASDEERAAYAVAIAIYDQFPIGEEVVIAARFPPENAVNIHPCGDDVRQGWRYENGMFSEPPPYVPPPPTAEQVRADRDARLAAATLKIDPLKDAVELGEATPAEEALYTAWRQYRVKLLRIEQQAGFPTAVEWPTPPEA